MAVSFVRMTGRGQQSRRQSRRQLNGMQLKRAGGGLDDEQHVLIWRVRSTTTKAATASPTRTKLSNSHMDSNRMDNNSMDNNTVRDTAKDTVIFTTPRVV